MVLPKTSSAFPLKPQWAIGLGPSTVILSFYCNICVSRLFLFTLMANKTNIKHGNLLVKGPVMAWRSLRLHLESNTALSLLCKWTNICVSSISMKYNTFLFTFPLEISFTISYSPCPTGPGLKSQPGEWHLTWHIILVLETGAKKSTESYQWYHQI